MSWSTILNPTTTSRERSRGFTLIELMIVVAIIGIMSSLAIGAYTKNIRKARKTMVVSNLSKLALREAAVFSLGGHYASTTAGEDVTSLYPTAGAFNSACAGGGGNSCDTPAWQIGVDGYTAQNGSGPYFALGGEMHGFDALSFMPDGGHSRCAYGVISGYGLNGSFPNGTANPVTPNTGMALGGEIWGNTDPVLTANDWFYAMARCDFDRDGGEWGSGAMWDFTVTNLLSNVDSNSDGAY
jgi:prepilin-type N-terminal cleavage/methylation domain-containing protein